MTRARRALHLTWARDYGVRRLKKISPFVLEALDVPKLPEEVLRASVLEDIRRYALSPGRPRRPPAPRPAGGTLRLSHVRVEDYLVCPLKYKFRHEMKVPVLPHHSLVFGRVLHETVHAYLKMRTEGPGGRRAGGRRRLPRRNGSTRASSAASTRNCARRPANGPCASSTGGRRPRGGGPTSWRSPSAGRRRGIRFSGRFDRIDFETAGPVIIDFKTTEVASEKEADRAAADSLQLDVYALSLLKTEGMLPVETRLHFLESGIVGRAVKGEKELKRAAERIREAAAGIRAGDFKARPDWHNCSACVFKTICPSSFAF
ncbi:MAG: PD-(D/E)XK nuclease family protein [Desulfomicrobium escambiense]|nr:PD-(D/E)XK nuclease family protein [Desulfomicrobium escambiense]